MATAPTAALAESFRQLAGTVEATIGIAIAPVGGSTTYAFGSWSTGVAWSTIKVPLAIAALRADRARAEPLVVKAITASDNRAAAQLWTQLGPAAQAARQVQRVIRESGDGTTVVQMRRLRPGFSAFGQTPWALNSQARFAAHLPCLSDTTVLDLMHRLVDEQRWGLAAQGAAAKGGWGPTGTGGYLVRQFGVMPNGPAKLGVALAAETGTFEHGKDALNRMSQWLTERLPELPGGHCPSVSPA